MSFAFRHLVVIATFRLKSGQFDKFLELAHAEASASLADEPGCFAFDVLVTDSDPTYAVLHEIYRDRDAFDQHKKKPRNLRFKANVEQLLVGDPVEQFFTTSVPG